MFVKKIGRLSLVSFSLALACFVLSAGVSAQVPRVLTIESKPFGGVNVSASLSDLDGLEGGLSGFTRQFAENESVTLEAPSGIGAHTFVKWKLDGVDFTTNPAATVTMDADHTLTALYFSNNQVLVNGSFETSTSGWTASGNLFVESEALGVATDGISWVAFNAGDETPNGELSQTFSTVPGQSYVVAFDVGTLSYYNDQQKMRVSVSGAGNPLPAQTITLTGLRNGNIEWESRSYSFVADSMSSTLTFTDVSQATLSVDLLLDHVRVYGSTSAPYGVPGVVDDSAAIHSGQKVRLPVLANDFGMMDQSTLVINSPPATGTVVVEDSGEVLYSHSGVDSLPVSFTYRVSGEGGMSAPATVNITISTDLRIPESGLHMPAAPPATAVSVEPAFPGVVFSGPVSLVSPAGDTERLFVAERNGKIKVIPDVTAESPVSSLVMDLAAALVSANRDPAESLLPDSTSESGLLGFAMHPDFATNGYLYLSYEVAKEGDSTFGYQRLSRFTVPAGQIDQPAPVADPSSEMILIEQRDRQDSHSGSDLHFGADGYLYWSIGDEGYPNDHWGNAQRIDMNFFSGMLRIDVDKKAGNLEPNAHPNPAAAALGYSTGNAIPRDEEPVGSGIFKARYSIPVDNPFVSTSQGGTWNGVFNGSPVSSASLPYVRSEFWAVGLRSPWRFTIDEPTGDIWLGDVGEGVYEELNIITKGGNYGWSFRSGYHAGPQADPGGLTLTDPVYEYVHTSKPGDANYKGNSIIGGVVYRGNRFATLAGAYIFGDYVSGNIWALRRPGGVVNVERIAGMPNLIAFGTDPSNGDVLICDLVPGPLKRIVTGAPDNSFPTTLGATRLFADLADLSPAPGLLPYEPNLRFWSDHAEKRRWFGVPDDASAMTWDRDGAWSFPSGQIWVKHFDLEMERGNPASPKRRLETRVLVKNDVGVYGVSYRWNEAGTEATLVPDGGDGFPVNITVDGAPYEQQWQIPSRSQCITCHSASAGHSLSFDTRQLNRENTIHGFSGNQLDLLYNAGYLNNAPDSPKSLPRHVRPDETRYSLEARVRSYLAVNCSYCHAGSSGSVAAAWDGRHQIPLDQTGLVNGIASTAAGDFRLIVPGDPAHSVVIQRLGGTSGFTRMPPLGSNEIDLENIALVTDWINQSLPNRLTYDEWRLQTFLSPDSPDGAPGGDPDGDGVSNRSEFLAGTLATSGSSFLRPAVSCTGSEVSLEFQLPENRSVQVETSADLSEWLRWDVPENDGIPLSGGSSTISGPQVTPRQFYRLLIRE